MEENKPGKTSNKEKITLNIDGKTENFTYSLEVVKENEQSNRTNNEAMDFLEETVNEGYFRLAYVDNIK